MITRRRTPCLTALALAVTLGPDTACNRSRDAAIDSPKVVARIQAAPAAPAATPVAATNGYPYDDISWVDSLIDKRIDVDSVVRSDTLAPGVVCYTLPRYVVIENSRRNEVGSDIIVRRRTQGAACGADSLAGDFVRRNEWAEYFLAMRGDRLFLDSGTGDVRGVLIYDVPAAKKITEFSGEIAGWRDSTTLLAWIAGGDSLPHARCPKVPEGLSAVADSLVSIDLRTNTQVPLKRWRCAGRE